MTDHTPNPADFSVDDRPREYSATFKIEATMSLHIMADTIEEAMRIAETTADKIANGEDDADFDEIDDVEVSHIRKAPRMFRILRAGAPMKVSHLIPGDLPREPDERGF